MKVCHSTSYLPTTKLMENTDKQFWTTDRIMSLIIATVLTLAVTWLMYRLRNALLPFFAACLLAYMLQPLVELNRKWLKLKGRVIASCLALLEVLLIVGGVVWLASPAVSKELAVLDKILAGISSGKEKLPPAYATIAAYLQRYVDLGHFSDILSNADFTHWIEKSLTIVERSASEIGHILSWLLMIVYLLFILIDYPQIARGFKQIIPLRYRQRAMGIAGEVLTSMNRYFRGQGCVALIAGALYTIGFLIIGLPLAVPMGMLVGVCYMIPYFQYATLLPVAAISLIYSLGGEVSFLSLMGKSLLVYVACQCICDYLVTPHIMGKELGLNPAIILLSLAVWGSLFGIVGMIIALPATALIMTYYRLYISNRK